MLRAFVAVCLFICLVLPTATRAQTYHAEINTHVIDPCILAGVRHQGLDDLMDEHEAVVMMKMLMGTVSERWSMPFRPRSEGKTAARAWCSIRHFAECVSRTLSAAATDTGKRRAAKMLCARQTDQACACRVARAGTARRERLMPCSRVTRPPKPFRCAIVRRILRQSVIDGGLPWLSASGATRAAGSCLSIRMVFVLAANRWLARYLARSRT